ncbi:MAG: ABC transporter permease subunit [Chloroflexi bacterium]|nr:ABC transporter permease subunit [Chloroflexota bacterium]
MIPLTPLLRAFRSEMLKYRGWSMFAGTGIMLVVSAFLASLTFHQIISGATGQEIDPLVHAFPTKLGLITVVGQARSFIIAVALIIVTANLAAEWSQGTWRNLLVREPRRLRLLAGKMLALMLFVLVSMTLTLFLSSVLILALAAAQGVQTAAWTSVAGLSAWLAFFGNEGLCLIGVCLLGMLIAVLTRSTGIAVGVALAYVLVPEGIIAMVWNEGSRWFPIRTFNFLPGSVFPTDVGPTPPQGYTAALLVALGWMTVLVVGSCVAFRRQDINA